MVAKSRRQSGNVDHTHFAHGWRGSVFLCRWTTPLCVILTERQRVKEHPAVLRLVLLANGGREARSGDATQLNINENGLS